MSEDICQKFWKWGGEEKNVLYSFFLNNKMEKYQIYPHFDDFFLYEDVHIFF